MSPDEASASSWAEDTGEMAARVVCVRRDIGGMKPAEFCGPRESVREPKTKARAVGPGLVSHSLVIALGKPNGTRSNHLGRVA